MTPGAWHDVVITEIMADPKSVSDDDGEWLEITPTSAVLHRAGGRRRRFEPDDDQP